MYQVCVLGKGKISCDSSEKRDTMPRSIQSGEQSEAEKMFT